MLLKIKADFFVFKKLGISCVSFDWGSFNPVTQSKRIPASLTSRLAPPMAAEVKHIGQAHKLIWKASGGTGLSSNCYNTLHCSNSPLVCQMEDLLGKNE